MLIGGGASGARFPKLLLELLLVPALSSCCKAMGFVMVFSALPFVAAELRFDGSFSSFRCEWSTLHDLASISALTGPSGKGV